MRLDPPPTTPESEHRRRIGAVQEAMKREGFKLLIAYADCWRTANVRYFTDFRPVDGVHTIAQAVIALPAESDPTLFTGDGCLDYAASETAFDVAELEHLPLYLRRHLNADGRVALAGEEQIPVGLHRTIAEAIAPAPLVASNLLAKIKAVKSPWELEQLRHAAVLTDLGMEAVQQAVSTAGQVTERQLARAADVAMINAGADTPAYLSMVQAGPRSAFSLALPTNRVLERGDLVLTDIGARYGNYVADGGRGFVYGPPSGQAREIIDAAADAVEAGLAAARPGISAADLNGAIQAVLIERGYAEFSGEARGRGTGHGTGMDPEEELPWIGPTDHTVIEQGSVFTLKATINHPQVGGLRTERIVHLGATGLELLDTFPMRNFW
ncbi:Xaa-Pro aminopeptidase [Arthrobacter pigmenti]|uniref:Xaa-Pro aminopeptidase n=1 Tax=Arthrobacter pigmenti TaxID=271432 RepID=A0A846RNC5_9MICC|nr:Xaa-Pro peptidase family protein [Arthrobacter pigmenti]NJC21647.1 Xaa-Pro aminopeptidase [Arthrobacter pigmenti]